MRQHDFHGKDLMLMMVKFSDLNIQFSIENIQFIALNLVNERFFRSIPSHSHSSNSYEIHYIPYGYGTAIIEGKKYDITPNTLFITGPHIEHAQEPLAEDPMVEYCIYLKVNSQKGQNTSASQVSTFINTSFWYGQDSQNMLPLMQQLFYELEVHPIAYQFEVQTLLQQCIIKMVRNYLSTNSAISKPHVQSLFGHSNLFDQKYIIIEECFLYEYQDITLQKLADRLGLGIRQTERLLKGQYGKTFLQKKTEARMSAAAILLKNPKKSITSISSDLGYSTVEHFSNAFKRFYHCSARDYRKLL